MAAWRPGQSGNPSGRRRNGDAAKPSRLPSLQKCLRKLGGPSGERWAKELHELAMNRQLDANTRIKAIGLLAPYLWRRAPESVEVRGTLVGAVRVVHQYFPPAGGSMIEAQSTEDVRRPITGEPSS